MPLTPAQLRALGARKPRHLPATLHLNETGLYISIADPTQPGGPCFIDVPAPHRAHCLRLLFTSETMSP